MAKPRAPFDPDEADRMRDNSGDLFSNTPFGMGMEASEAAADASWTEEQRDRVLEAIRRCAEVYESFTTDAVWEFAGAEIPRSKGIGALLRTAVRRGWIANSGFTTTSRRAEGNHAQRLTVWSSILKAGERDETEIRIERALSNYPEKALNGMDGTPLIAAITSKGQLAAFLRWYEENR